jgi:hypothetical protein
MVRFRVSWASAGAEVPTAAAAKASADILIRMVFMFSSLMAFADFLRSRR